MRLTTQRKIILEELKKVTSHPTALELYDLVRRRLPKISLATVYRNLELLAARGLVQKLEGAGTQRRFDGTVQTHYHIRCLACRQVEDVALSPAAGLEEVAGALSDYEILGHRLEFFGLCPRCRGKSRELGNVAMGQW